MVFKQNIINYCAISFSALVFAGAFMLPYYCAEGVFFFLLPILYCVCSKRAVISGKHGFVWGLVFYAFFFSDVFYLIMARGMGTYRSIAVIFLLFYGALTTSLWFISAQYVTRYLCKNRVYGWLLATVAYFTWVEHCFFIIFGAWQGNCLHYIGLPLAIRPTWLYSIHLIGKCGFAASILWINGLIFLWLTQHNKRAFSMLVLWGIFFFSGWILYNPQPLPAWAKEFGFIAAYTHETDHMHAAEHIKMLLDQFALQYPQCRYIVMPESSFKFPLNKYEHYLALWNCGDYTLFMGSHRYKKNFLYNSLFCITQGSIVHWYDKRNILFFTEYIPDAWRSIPGSDKLFLSQSLPFMPGAISSDFDICPIGQFKPLICSDLFLDTKNMVKRSKYICIVNDSWFSMAYIPCLMYLHAQMVALEKESVLIYSGYHYNCIFDPSGTCYNLPGVAQKRDHS